MKIASSFSSNCVRFSTAFFHRALRVSKESSTEEKLIPFCFPGDLRDFSV